MKVKTNVFQFIGHRSAFILSYLCASVSLWFSFAILMRRARLRCGNFSANDFLSSCSSAGSYQTAINLKGMGNLSVKI